jgi:DNA mismatch repair ATPase MutS
MPMRCFNELYAKLNVFDCAHQTSGASGAPGVPTETRSLYALLNSTRTKMGARLLRDRLVRVSTAIGVMRSRYDLVDALLPSNRNRNREANATYEVLHKSLHCIDLERMYRRFSLGNLQPHDIPRVMRSQANLLTVLEHLDALPSEHVLKTTLLLTRRTRGGEGGGEGGGGGGGGERGGGRCALTRLRAYQETLEGVFDEEKCAHVTLTNLGTTLFRHGYSAEIDAAVATHETAAASVDLLAEALMACVPNIKLSANTTSWIHVKKSDKDGYWLEVSKTRYPHLKTALAGMTAGAKRAFAEHTRNAWSVDDLTFSAPTKSVVRIACAQLQAVSTALQQTHQDIVRLVKDTYTRRLQAFYAEHYAATIAPVLQLVAKLDVAFSTATNATRHGYTRPVLVDDAPSSVEATALRHPLIEHMLVRAGKKDPYVPNDVKLCRASCWLLHGVNSVGKSSLLKSIAIGVLMAQAGLFVAATDFRLSPYHKIFARTGNDDNIHVAHSSFVKEMTETKSIVDNADARSLVIADELCASTEVYSAVRIVGALLQLLTKRRATYAFATHLFALQDHPFVQQLLCEQRLLHNLHLQVRFANGKLLFDRTLSAGLPANREYGVLVADKVIQNKEFTSLLAHASQVRSRPDANASASASASASAGASASATVVPVASAASVTSVSKYHPNDNHTHTNHTTHTNTPLAVPHPIDRSQPPPRATAIAASRPVTTSRYNSKLWMEECAVCKYRPLTTRHLPLDTHHIREQQHADPQTGLFEHRFHKNERQNLVPLCKPCHLKIDTGELVIEGHVSTSDGPELVWCASC